MVYLIKFRSTFAPEFKSTHHQMDEGPDLYRILT